jgi:sigma-E factor negative regulatory protein RseC
MSQEVRARVVHVEAHYAWVRLLEKAGGCGRCHEPGGCGSTQLTHVFKAPCDTFKLPNSVGAVVGDEVVLQLADGVALRAAFTAYAIPLILGLLGAALGTYWARPGDDLPASAGLLAGLAAGMLWTRIWLRRRPDALKMTMLTVTEPRQCAN